MKLSRYLFVGFFALFFIGSFSLCPSAVHAASLTTSYPSSVASSSATLNGSIDDFTGLSGSTTYGFVWGLTTAYGATTTAGTTSSSTPFSFTSNITGLTPGTKYHYQAYLTNSGNTIYGSDQVLNTPLGLSFVAANSGNWNNHATWGLGLNKPQGIVLGPDGNLYISDTGNNRIVKMATSTGAIIATYNLSGSSDSFSSPIGIAFDSGGIMYVADSGHSRVVKVATTTNSLATAYNLDSAGTTWPTQYAAPYGLTFDPSGNLYVSDLNKNRIIEIATSTGSTTIKIDLVAPSFGEHITGISFDQFGNFFGIEVQPITPGNNDLFLFGSNLMPIAANYTLSPNYGGVTQLHNPYGLAFDQAGNPYVTESNRVIEISTSTQYGTIAHSYDLTGGVDAFNAPQGLTLDSDGNIYVADTGNSRIVKIATTTNSVAVMYTGVGSSEAEGVTYPGANDNATIPNSHTVAMTQDQSARNVTVQSGGTLNENRHTLTVSVDTNNYSGTINTGFYAPIIATGGHSSETQTSAIVSGTITDVGGSNATARGFAISTDDAITFNQATSESSSFSTGSFSATLSSLTCGTTYYYESFATNPYGTSYGNARSLPTLACSSAGGGGGGVTTNTSSSNGGGGGGYLPIITPQVVASSTVVVTQPQIFNRDLQINSTGADVKSLQVFLNNNGYVIATGGNGSLGHETLTFGTLTQKALIKFQKANKIVPVSGIFDVTTRNLVNAIINALSISSGPKIYTTPFEQASSTQTIKQKFTKNLSVGSTNAEVKSLQIFLNSKGFVISSKGNGSIGKETTYFGTATQKALMKFQKVNSIVPASGIFGPKTRTLVNGML